MKKMKLIGILLVSAAVLMILGILINHHILWSVVDVVVILITFGCGWYILSQKQ